MTATFLFIIGVLIGIIAFCIWIVSSREEIANIKRQQRNESRFEKQLARERISPTPRYYEEEGDK